MTQKFVVGIVSKAIHTDYYEVEASSEAEALQKADDGDVGRYRDSHTEISHHAVDFRIEK
jgi:hypothetical protein